MIFGPILIAKVTILLSIASLAYLAGGKFSSRMRHTLCILATVLVCLAAFSTINFPSRALPVFGITAAAAANPATSTSPLLLIPLVWLTGSLLVFLRFLLGLAYLMKHSRCARTIQWKESTAPVRFSSVSMPMLWGWLRPEILLPKEAEAWTTNMIDLVVRHELVHLQRRDNWIALLVAIARVLYWFHPLVWWLTSKLVIEQEVICDERVLASGASATDYAELLVNVSRNLTSPSMFGCAMASSVIQLRGRIMKILDYPSATFPSKANRLAFLLTLTALAAGSLLLPARAADLAAIQPGAIYKIGAGVSAPKVIRKQEPTYTKEATRKKIQGITVLSLVIDSKGLPGSIEVVKSLDAGLDQKAIEAVRQWRFNPAMKDGQPVAVHANIEVHFRLK